MVCLWQLSFISCMYYRDCIRNWLAESRMWNVWMLQHVKSQTLQSRLTGQLTCQRGARQRRGASRHQELRTTVERRRSLPQHEVALRQVQLDGARLRQLLAHQWEFYHPCGVWLRRSLALRVVLQQQ